MNISFPYIQKSFCLYIPLSWTFMYHGLTLACRYFADYSATKKYERKRDGIDGKCPSALRKMPFRPAKRHLPAAEKAPIARESAPAGRQRGKRRNAAHAEAVCKGLFISIRNV